MPKPGLIFLYGEFVPRCTHHIDKQYVGYQTLQYMAGGGVELSIGPKRWLLEGQWFWSAYPGPRIHFKAAAGYSAWVHRYIAFQGPLVRTWEKEGIFPIAPRQAPSGIDFGHRFDELLRYSQRSDSAGQRRAIHLLEGLLLELADTREQPIQAVPWMDQALRILTDRPWTDVIDYGPLAEQLGISQSTLRRKFQQAVGTSPHAYVLQCRTAEARRLLGETDLSIKQIADRLGYSDVYFFTRQFKQLSGVPPGTYRKSRQR
jgi:AraC-like DNA-binding protein